MGDGAAMWFVQCTMDRIRTQVSAVVARVSALEAVVKDRMRHEIDSLMVFVSAQREQLRQLRERHEDHTLQIMALRDEIRELREAAASNSEFINSF